MNTTKMVTAAGLASLLIVGSVSVNAIDINNEVTGVSHSTGVDTNGDGFFASINNSVSKRLDKGKKTLEGNTAIGRSEILPWDESSLCFDHPSQIGIGAKFRYLSSTAVSILENGDQVFSILDQSEDRESYLCFREDGSVNSIVVHRIITGGTGAFENACGYTEFGGTTLNLAGGLISTKGVVTGEIFDKNAAPSGVHGCEE